jgi:hypothetical protein
VITLSASDLRSYQTCRRRFLLERHWKVARWRPSSLFRSCLREGVFRLSNGADPATVRSNARTRFLSQAANPGLDVMTGDPWTVAQDWAGMLGTTLTAISRLTLLTLTKPSPRPLSTEASWLPLAWLDDSGTLHRWITCDAWDEEVLAREAHSWHVVGDMAMLDAPLMLHAIEIGQQRQGRRHSPWARCYRHPVIAGMHRFQRPDGKGGWRKLSGEKWTPVWYADQAKPDPEQWCDLMDADHVTPSRLHHVPIAQPSQAQADRIRTEMLQVASAIGTGLSASVDPMDEPMTRPACDPVTGPCPWQVACLPCDPLVQIGDVGLYAARAGGRDGRSIPQPSPQTASA